MHAARRAAGRNDDAGAGNGGAGAGADAVEERQLLLTRIDRDPSETAAERKRNRLAIEAKENEMADVQ